MFYQFTNQSIDKFICWSVSFYVNLYVNQLGILNAHPPPRCTKSSKCNSPPINGQCTNFILFDVAL